MGVVVGGGARGERPAAGVTVARGMARVFDHAAATARALVAVVGPEDSCLGLGLGVGLGLG